MGQLARVSSGAPWEPIVAYSRAVRAGDFVAISGTTATDERGLVVGGGQMYVQARQALSNIQRALQQFGLSMSDVVRTRMFVTDISRLAEVARAHHEFFADSPPASTMVQVTRLVHPAMLIEIEAEAYAGSTAAAPSAKAGSRAPKPSRAAKVKPKNAAKKAAAKSKKRK
jgi:enamine deaminase RidA (YjgF/YER057c/UK114 family)